LLNFKHSTGTESCSTTSLKRAKVTPQMLIKYPSHFELQTRDTNRAGKPIFFRKKFLGFNVRRADTK